MKKIIKSLIRMFFPRSIRFFIRQIILRGKLFKYIHFIYLYIKEYPKGKAFINESFDYYLIVVAIVKNEALYIAEWIEYHLLVGVEKFYIYDNGSTDNLTEVLASYIKDNLVEYIPFPGKLMHVPAYNNAVKRLRSKSFWIAFIDIDEFIVPVETQTISEFLHEFENYPGVEINWVLYGSSGHKKKTDGLVMERFKYHDIWDSQYNRIVKSIHNPRCVFYLNPHVADYIYGNTSVNTNKNKNIDGSYNRIPLHNKLRINHYFLKSYEEFLIKVSRGRSAVSANLKTDEFYERDCNDIKNDAIMDKYIPIVKEKIRERFGEALNPAGRIRNEK